MVYLPDPNGIVSTGNSGSLSGGFTGTYENVSEYSTATVTAIGNATITVTFYDSIDGTDGKAITQTASIKNSGTVTHAITTKFLKITTAPTATGDIQTVYDKSGNTKIRVAKNYKGRYEEIPVNYVGSTMSDFTSIISPLDAFGRLQVSDPFTLLGSKQQTSGVSNVGSPFDYDILLNPAADPTKAKTTYNSGLPQTTMTLTTTAAAGNKVVIQQHGYNVYQPGKSLQALITGTILTNLAVTGVTARIGYFDDKNDKTVDGVKTGDGFFFEYIGGDKMYVVYRNSNALTYTAAGPPPTVTQTDYPIAQSSWNIDPLDGTGPSGVTADWTKRQIFVLSMEWLGVGNVLMGIVYNFKFLWCHQWKFSGGQYAPEGANIGQLAYDTRASLPVRYELVATAAPSSTAEMIQVCSSVNSEGGFIPYGPIYSTYQTFGTATSHTNASETPLLGVKLNTISTAGATYYKNRPRVTLNILGVELMCTTSSNVIYRIYKCYGIPTFTTAGTWVNSDSGGVLGTQLYGSAAEYNVTMNGTITFPTKYVLVFEGVFATTVNQSVQDFSDKIVCQSDIAGTSDCILVTVLPAGPGSETIIGSMKWQEYG